MTTKNKSNAGRKNKYDTNVKPYLKEIEEWSKTCTDKDIAKMLNITEASFCTYKNKHSELKEALERGRLILVANCWSNLIKLANGFFYEEEEEITNTNPKGVSNITTKKSKKYIKPSVAANVILLNNYCKDFINRDIKSQEIKEKEIDLKEKNFEKDNW